MVSDRHDRCWICWLPTEMEGFVAGFRESKSIIFYDVEVPKEAYECGWPITVRCVVGKGIAISPSFDT